MSRERRRLLLGSSAGQGIAGNVILRYSIDSVRHEWESLPATISTVVTHGLVSLSHAYSILQYQYRNYPSPTSDPPCSEATSASLQIMNMGHINDVLMFAQVYSEDVKSTKEKQQPLEENFTRILFEIIVNEVTKVDKAAKAAKAKA
ncbi:hypothetical protein B0T24DRAFT_684335 [Lasiosphaeria ovina]|uniref:Uncharacterized protein n=1 Tax=Lasiosphaeria ovina TaxID=92902 RepID=A0AAE0JUL7_9PEZI|nr:hypothetical protein B0T24DRAFT_684335 [Lasiosphaeria ovina]